MNKFSLAFLVFPIVSLSVNLLVNLSIIPIVKAQSEGWVNRCSCDVFGVCHRTGFHKLIIRFLFDVIMGEPAEGGGNWAVIVSHLVESGFPSLGLSHPSMSFGDLL